MSRIGIRPDESGLAFVRKCMETPGIEIEGIFTHFARADETDKTPARQQLEQFLDFTGRIRRELGIHIPVQHCSNSAGIVGLGKQTWMWSGRNHPLRPVAVGAGGKGYRSFRAGALLKKPHRIHKRTGSRQGCQLRRDLRDAGSHPGSHHTGRIWGWISQRPFQQGQRADRGKTRADSGTDMHGSVMVDVTGIPEAKEATWSPS